MRPNDSTEKVVAPGREDPFVSGLAEAIGGPRGTHAVPETPSRGGGFWTAARIVLALTCLTLVFHWVQKSPCRDGAWQDLSQYTNFCYTDVLALYYAEGLNQGKVPYVPDGDDHQVEYPVLTGAMMALIGLPVHAMGQNDPSLNQGQAFYDLTALALMAFAVSTVAMILSLRRRRPWDAALFALAPTLLVTTTVNWDFLAIVLAIAGLWFWARRQPLAAGIMLGLGAAAKLWPGFLLGPIIVLCIRNREFRPMGLAIGGAAGAWLVTNVPVMMLSYEDWHRFIELNQTRAIDWGTLWYIGRFFDSDLLSGGSAALFADIPLVTNLALLLFLLGCLGVAGLALQSHTPPRLAQLAFLVIAIFLVTSKVWSQQFTLWLLPLIVLARPKWGAFLFWQVAEVCYFLAFYLELMGASGRQVIPEGTFVFASIMRLAAVVTLIVLVIREIRYPELDVVRQTYRGDPDWPSVNTTASANSLRSTPSPSTGAVSADS
ncbi:glycosyltransferase family 87 protein [Allorhizocola rhizosphaerae]|uniref:glycosyltransferase family 87 protein n=1 Tax=Allorhizocola rhizosphaerae TaxID=1872709 RepID=UPI000E3BF8D4|nr:glycosyltransferase 87 family protein [Allorhizocola rhizosphaerae]